MSSVEEVPKWCIYYYNGGTFSSKDGSPQDAPLDGIQVIVEYLNGNVQYHRDRDFYMWTGDCWTAGFERDFHTWVRNLLPQVKYGFCISNEAYRRIIGEALSGSSG